MTVSPGSKLRLEHPLGERILDLVLDLAPQRPRTVGLVVALGDDRVLGRIGHHELHLLPVRAAPSPRASSRSTISRISSQRELPEDDVASIRLRNSGRKVFFSSARTFSFIRS